MRSSLSRTLRLVLPALLIAGAIAGCAKPLKNVYQPNIPPTVRLTSAPFDDGSVYFYAYRLNWYGNDPDGRVVSYVYAIDPPEDGSPIQWTSTTKNEQIVFFKATRRDSADSLRSIDFHTFAIRAVDNQQDSSETVTRSFFSYTVAPTVNITAPHPSALQVALVSPAVRITWTGTDIDGQFTTKPVKYKYTLLGPGSEFPIDQAIGAGGGSKLRDYYAPTFAGWDSTSAETTTVQYTNLTPGTTYLFVVVAFDEAGAYSPVFSLDTNMLRFRVTYAGNLGPKITMFNEYFNYKYASGGYSTDPSREVFIEVPAGQRVNFNWFAEAATGSDIESYRWALDIADVSDDTPRTNEETDLSHWSIAGLLNTQATVGPFAGGEVHRFYIEARDNNNLRSLGIVRFSVVQSTLNRPMLIVDDTRFLGDETGPGGCVKAPKGAWPTAAELDTFLYARGSAGTSAFPSGSGGISAPSVWRCYPPGGAVTMTPAGLFAGYVFDTTGTRRGDNEVVVRLSELGNYAHVVWLVDGAGATNDKPGTNPSAPITALRYMSGPGRFNSLAAYVKQGGKVWLTGGGGMSATLFPWNQNNNDAGGVTWSNDLGELIPGRFMYDLAAWRSECKVVTASGFVLRFLGRDPSWPGVPDYTKLPVQMRGKSSALDPLPPGRAGQSVSVYYKSTYAFEFLSLSNYVLEDLNADPDTTDEQSVLDSLYQVVTFALPRTTAIRVMMTYYHGPLSTPFVFTGFSIWDYTHDDCQTLVDFVLQDIWGMSKNLGPPTGYTAARAAPVPPQPAARAVSASPPRGVLRPSTQGRLNPSREQN